MSDVSPPRRCPRSKVSAPGPRGGSHSSRGGGSSHLKPPAPGSVCKHETPIRRAPQEGIDDSPPPGRAAPRLPGRRQLAAGRPSPGSPRQVALEVRPPHRGMARGRLPLRFGAVPLLLPGGGGRSRQETGRETEAGISARTRRPPAASAEPPCPPVRAPPAASEPHAGGASRAPIANDWQPGTRARRGPAFSPRRARALPVPPLFSGAPQNPRFQRPQLEPLPAPPPPPPRFQHCNCRGRYFLAYGSRRFPRRRGGGQAGARGAGRGAEGEVRPGEHPRGRPETLRSSGPPLPGAEAEAGRERRLRAP